MAGSRGIIRWLVALTLIAIAGGVFALGIPSRSQPSHRGIDPDPYTFCRVLQFAWTDSGVVARAGQPPAQSLDCLREAGFAAVVNLRHEQPGYDEAAAVEAAGMEYLHMPIVDDTASSPEQVIEYMRFIETHRRDRKPVLTHDAAGRGRMGFMDGIYLLWQGWSTADVFERYIHFGAKIDCENGGNGQAQGLHEIGVALRRGDAWPEGQDQAGNSWSNCARPAYMANWSYSAAMFPPSPRAYLPLMRAQSRPTQEVGARRAAPRHSFSIRLRLNRNEGGYGI